MTTEDEKWDYLAVKSLSRLLHRFTSNNNDDRYCKNCLHLFRIESKLKTLENVRKNYNYCKIKSLRFATKHLSLIRTINP